MNELQKLSNEISLANGISREKNLYKLQNVLCPQIYQGKQMDEVKRELQRNMILFSTTSDEDFISLLKIALVAYVESKKMGAKTIFNADYVLSFTRMLKYIREQYGCKDLDQLKIYISKHLEREYWEECFYKIIDYFSKPPREKVFGGEREYDFINEYKHKDDWKDWSF